MLCTVGSCSSSKKRDSASGPDVAAAPPPAPAAPVAPAAPPGALGPATNALLEAAAALRGEPAVEQWLSGAGTFAEAPPAAVNALVALRAWSTSGESLAIAELGEDLKRVIHLIRLGRVVMKGAGEPQGVLDLLAVAKALRVPGNFASAQVTGFAIANEVYSALRRAEPATTLPTSTLRELAPTEAEVLAFARGSLTWSVRLARQVTWEAVEREAAAPSSAVSDEPATADELVHTVAQVERYRRDAKLPLGEGWLRADYDAYAAFWDETERRVQAASEAQGVARVAAEQLAAATAHPSSMLVRLLGPLVLSDRLPTIVDDLQAQVATLRAGLAQ